jgi:hypothetical protein
MVCLQILIKIRLKQRNIFKYCMNGMLLNQNHKTELRKSWQLQRHLKNKVLVRNLVHSRGENFT